MVFSKTYVLEIFEFDAVVEVLISYAHLNLIDLVEIQPDYETVFQNFIIKNDPSYSVLVCGNRLLIANYQSIKQVKVLHLLVLD